VWLVAVLVSAIVRIWGGGGGSRVGKSSGCTRLRLWYELVSNLDSVGLLVSRIGGGLGVGFRPFVVHPPSCRDGKYIIILLCRRKYIVDLQ